MTAFEEIQQHLLWDSTLCTMPFMDNFAMDDVAVEIAENLQISADSGWLRDFFPLMSHVTGSNKRRLFGGNKRQCAVFTWNRS